METQARFVIPVGHSYAAPLVLPSMRNLRPRRSRGLAEIVGTLMLVVIVVAAATAFSFFVASYQKQLQAEETQSHDKALEKVRILNLRPMLNNSTNVSSLVLEIASLDVNSIVVTGLLLNGSPVIAYGVVNSAGRELDVGCLNGNPYVGNASCSLELAPEAQVFLKLWFDGFHKSTLTHTQPYAFLHGSNIRVTAIDFTESSVFDFQILTSLGNEFTQSFVPPVAVAGLSFVSSYPVLDGSNSYQPSSGSTGNATVDLWHWAVRTPSGTSPTAVPVGRTEETGTLLFVVPKHFQPTAPEKILIPSFSGSAGAGHVAGAQLNHSARGGYIGWGNLTNVVVGTVDEVSFSYAYSTTTLGNLFLPRAMLFDNGSLLSGPVPSISANDTGNYSGQEVQLADYLTPMVPYTIWLNITSTQSLMDTTHIEYTAA